MSIITIISRTFRIKSILQSVCIVFVLSAPSFGTEASNQESIFTLPNDLTQWQDATNLYMDPVLTTQALKNQWQILLDMTMPRDGNFDPVNTKRRESTIIMSYTKMLEQSEENRLAYLNGLLDRHTKYVKHIS